MDLTLEDGKGRGYKAGVTKSNKLLIEGDTLTEFQAETLNGNGYNINSTAPTTLTSANESAIWYFKNNEDSPVVIKEILVVLGDSTGGSGNGLARIYKNPSSGDIVTNATTATQINRDFSSAKLLTADNYRGVEGDSISGEDAVFATSSRASFDVPIRFDAEIIVLRKGNSIGVSWQPPSGNTSQTCVVASTIILETSEISNGGSV